MYNVIDTANAQATLAEIVKKKRGQKKWKLKVGEFVPWNNKQVSVADSCDTRNSFSCTGYVQRVFPSVHP
jgi:hypothetical protein